MGGFLRQLRKDLTGLVQVVYGYKMFLVIFQDRCEKYMTLNQLTIVTV